MKELIVVIYCIIGLVISYIRLGKATSDDNSSMMCIKGAIIMIAWLPYLMIKSLIKIKMTATSID